MTGYPQFGAQVPGVSLTQPQAGPVQPASTPKPAPTVYGNTAATSPKQTFINNQIATTPNNNPQATQASDSAALANGTAKDSQGNAITGFGTPTTPSTQTPTTPTAPSALDTARAAYLTSLTPDANVTAAQTAYQNSLSNNSAVSTAQTAYNNFENNEQQGETALSGQGRGIPLQLVRGQQAKLNQQSQLEAGLLQGDIGIAQGNQTAAQTAAKAGLDYATSNATLAQQKASAQLDFATTDAATATASAKANADLALTYANIAKTQGDTLTPAQAAAKADADIKKEAADTSQSYAAAAASLAAAAKSKADTNGNPANANTPGYDSSGNKYTTGSATQEVQSLWKNGYIQGNGKISSTDYQDGKAWWIQQGLSASDFDSEFNGLIDKSGSSWKTDYGYGSN